MTLTEWRLSATLAQSEEYQIIEEKVGQPVNLDFVDLIAKAWRFYKSVAPIEWGQWRVERALYWALENSRGVRRIRTHDGFLMDLDLADFLQRHIYVTGTWEPATAAALTARLKPGDVFIDIGANVGYFSLLAAQIVGTEGRVLAFEPNPEVFERLRRNADLNTATCIQMYRLGIGAQAGTARFFIDPSGNTGASSLAGQTRDGNNLDIQLDTLDNISQLENLTRVAMLKIDIEGAELQALQGARNVLHIHRPDIICEVSEGSLEKMGASKEALYDLLAEFGYAGRTISRVRVDEVVNGHTFYQYDVLFSRKIGS